MRQNRRLPARRALLTGVMVAALAVAGCGASTPESDAPATSGGAFPAAVGTVTVAQRPTKIVSLSPTTTEVLFALGAGSQVIAVDDQSNYPAQAPKTDLSGFKPNAEAIAAKNPDLVVLASNTNKIVDQLTALKIPVYLAPAAKTLDAMYGQMSDLGVLTGHTQEAGALVSQTKTDIAAIVKDVKPRNRKLTYYHEINETLYAATSKTFIGSVYTLLGLENIADAADAAGGGYPQLSNEAVVKANPDLIFLADTKCCQQSAVTIAARPGFADLAAVKKGQIVELDDNIASRWGPRIVDLLRAAAAAVAKVPAE